MNRDEAMYVAQAIYKGVAEEVKKGGGGLRDEFDARFVQRYHDTGAKTYDALLMGEKVGSVTVKPDEPKPKTSFGVADYEALEDWYPGAEEAFWKFVVANLADFAEFWFLNTGEVPPGCEIKTVTPEPKEPTVTLRIDGKKVADVLGGLPGDMRPLLGGE